MKRLSSRDALQQLHFEEYNTLARYQQAGVPFEYFEWLALHRHREHRNDRAGIAYCKGDPKRDQNQSPF